MRLLAWLVESSWETPPGLGNMNALEVKVAQADDDLQARLDSLRL